MNNSSKLHMTGVTHVLSNSSSPAIAHKLGGDNMSLAQENMEVAKILGDQGVTQNFSVSAFRSSKVGFNTTSKLISAGKSQNQEVILNTLQEISDFHTELLEEILSSCSSKIKVQLMNYAKDLFAQYKTDSTQSDLTSCRESSDYMLGVGEKAFSLLSIGEVIAAKVFTKYLELHGIPAVYVDTTHFRNIDPSSLADNISEFLQNEFTNIYSGNPSAIPIIPGYIGGINGGILKTLDRGYTDYTGERAAVSLHDSGKYDQVILYIQKMYGFKSTDPRELEDTDSAKSVNKLSYALAKRAIAKNGAAAGLINQNTLSQDVIKRKIAMLVGNPTDNSDVALIDQYGDPLSRGVQLVLGRPYNSEYDNRTYNRLNRSSENHHLVYLMGDNLQDIGDIYKRACKALQDANIHDVAGESKLHNPKEMSFVFRTAQDTQRAQRVLHGEFVEK